MRPDEGPRIFHDAVIRDLGLGVRLVAALLDVLVHVLPPEPDAVVRGEQGDPSLRYEMESRDESVRPSYPSAVDLRRFLQNLESR